MSFAICTLFEGDYHYGVAALANSLYQKGFRGDIYAGFRGELPLWTDLARSNPLLNWNGGKTLNILDELQMHFLPLETNYHLTNYKPDFMLRLVENVDQDIEGIFYFDPDIVISAPWDFFQNWITCGIALCEDVNSPLPEFHPRRVAWRRYYKEFDILLEFKNQIYANGGFVGLTKSNFDFLSVWKRLQENMAKCIGGLERSTLSDETKLPDEMNGAFAPFGKTDQDALNATVEVWQGNISFMGIDGMTFKSLTGVMHHALGKPKPWKYNPLKEILNGKPPHTSVKTYWDSVSGPIKTYPSRKVLQMKFLLNLSSLLGRFYQK